MQSVHPQDDTGAEYSASNPFPVNPVSSVASPIYISNVALPTGGATPYHLISAATTNAINLKGSAGVIESILVVNVTATVVFMKVYDKATTPVPGTDTPVLNIPIPASVSGAGIAMSPFSGIQFNNGIGIAITANIADADATAIAANALIVNIVYK